MNGFGLFHDCYAETRLGEIVGPLRKVDQSTNYPWRMATANEPRCWDDFGLSSQRSQFKDPLDLVRVLTDDETQGFETDEHLPQPKLATDEAKVIEQRAAKLSASKTYGMMFHGIDKLQPALKNFLEAIYPDARLRAVEFHSDHELTADYGKPRNHAATVSVEIGVEGKLPTWIDENESAPGSGAIPKMEGGQSGLGSIRYRHKVRGTEYDLIGFGKIQSADWVYPHRYRDMGEWETDMLKVDMREVAIYRSVANGELWVRPREEFEDGRFEPIPHSPSPSTPL